jgi:hypothetical protein
MADNFPQVPRRLNLQKELPKKPEHVPKWLKVLVDALNQQNDKISNTISGMQGADILANRPIAGIKGRTFWSTDTLHFYTDDGTSWVLLV